MAAMTIPSANDPALRTMVERLSGVYRPERIYLYGSVARGDAGPDSDYDLLIVVPDDASADLLRSRPAYRASRDLGIPRDVLVMKSSEFQSQLPLRASLPSTVAREGIVLYGRG
jgi:predicted nucleotidyltransferase